MKHPPLHTLVLLSVLFHSGSCTGGHGQCVPLFVRVGEKATIKCSIPNPDQDGVYMYKQPDKDFYSSTEETLLYYYKDGSFTPEEPYENRLGTNGNFSDFLVSIKNVSEDDSGVYWCKFNKRDVYTFSEGTHLVVQPGPEEKCPGETKSDVLVYQVVIIVLLFIILVLTAVLMKQCCVRGKYTPKPHPSNGVYEVMRGNTSKALVNPAYEPSQRRTPSDSR